MDKLEMIKSHREQIRALKIQRNIDVMKSTCVLKTMDIIESYGNDIKAYQDDIKLLEINLI